MRFDPSRTTRLLGVEQQAGNVDWMGSTATPDGRRWGMPDWYLAGWAVPTDQVTTVLAIDEWGLASAWVKTFGAVPGSGFVRALGARGPDSRPLLGPGRRRARRVASALSFQLSARGLRIASG